MRNLLGHSDSYAGEEPPFQYLDGIILQRTERADEEQGGDHDAREGYDGDRLDGKGKGVGQLLNRQRDDQGEQADGQ